MRALKKVSSTVLMVISDRKVAGASVWCSNDSQSIKSHNNIELSSNAITLDDHMFASCMGSMMISIKLYL